MADGDGESHKSLSPLPFALLLLSVAESNRAGSSGLALGRVLVSRPSGQKWALVTDSRGEENHFHRGQQAEQTTALSCSLESLYVRTLGSGPLYHIEGWFGLIVSAIKG